MQNIFFVLKFASQQTYFPCKCNRTICVCCESDLLASYSRFPDCHSPRFRFFGWKYFGNVSTQEQTKSSGLLCISANLFLKTSAQNLYYSFLLIYYLFKLLSKISLFEKNNDFPSMCSFSWIWSIKSPAMSEDDAASWGKF